MKKEIINLEVAAEFLGFSDGGEKFCGLMEEYGWKYATAGKGAGNAIYVAYRRRLDSIRDLNMFRKASDAFRNAYQCTWTVRTEWDLAN